MQEADEGETELQIGFPKAACGFREEKDLTHPISPEATKRQQALRRDTAVSTPLSLTSDGPSLLFKYPVPFGVPISTRNIANGVKYCT